MERRHAPLHSGLCVAADVSGGLLVLVVVAERRGVPEGKESIEYLADRGDQAAS